jgi:hypothetical protein
MTKAKISEYDAVASNNTDVNGVNIAENCPPSGMNNMGREIMAALKRFQVGSDGDGVTVGGNLVVSGTSTVAALNTSGAVVFNDAGADVDFRVEGDTDANLLFVDASTDRVGIGTNTPDALLSVDGIASFGAGSASTPSIAAAGDLNTGMFFPAADTIAFAEGGAEAIRIDADGRLLIGNTSSNSAFNSAFQIQGSGLAGTMLVNRFNASIGGPNLYFAKSRSATIGTNTIVNSGDQFGIINFAGANGTGYDTGAQIYAEVDGTPGASGDMPGRLVFSTTPDGSDVPTERARITSGGYLKASNTGSYINTSGPHHEFLNDSFDNVIMFARNTSASPYGIYVDFTTDPNNATNYVFAANSGASLVYRIFSNGTTSARSDAKWKKNIETARDGYIDDLARLRVVKYNWHNHEDGTPKEMGLIAQEVEEVFPGLVQEDEEKRDEVRTREIPAVLDEDGNEVEPARTEEYTEQVGTGEYTKSIKFSVFTPMLIKAVQELKAITDTQAQTIAALEARIAALEA